MSKAPSFSLVVLSICALVLTLAIIILIKAQ